VKLRDQLIGTLREAILLHRGEDVREIVEIPEIRQRFEVLWPIPVAATHFYRHQVRKFIAAEVDTDGVRQYASVEQLTLLDEPENDGATLIALPHRYVTREEMVSDDALVRSYLTSTHKHIMGIVRRSQLPNQVKIRLMKAIDEAFAKAEKAA